MSHKADSSFFNSKKEWSRRKDLILDYYLAPYLAKVAKLGRPILIVDGFAGPGRFEDGEAGSPLIICERAKVGIDRGAKINVWCIERDENNEGLFDKLVQNLRPYPFARAERCTFLSKIDEIERLAKTHTIFLYVDPFTVEGLEWESLDRVLSHLFKSGSSIELLMNFNASSFARRGLAALKMEVPRLKEEESEDPASPTVEKLNRVVGGDWWMEIVAGTSTFESKVNSVTAEFCRRLHNRFNEVCQHRVKENVSHTIPKYILIFGSRHPDALLLMNEAMIQSRLKFADASRPAAGSLFETLPTDVVPDPKQLPNIILNVCDRPIARKNLILRVVRKAFCDFSEKEIKNAIKEMVKDGKLYASPDDNQWNDATFLSKSPTNATS